MTVPFPVCLSGGVSSVTDVGPPLAAAEVVAWLAVSVGSLVSVDVPAGGLGVDVRVGVVVTVGVADTLGNGVEVENAAGPGWAIAWPVGDAVGGKMFPLVSEMLLAAFINESLSVFWGAGGSAKMLPRTGVVVIGSLAGNMLVGASVGVGSPSAKRVAVGGTATALARAT